MDILSKNFRLSELTRSATAEKYRINNTPTESHIENLRRLCVYCLQPARDKYGKPIVINNGYRSVALNNAMKKEGYLVSATSQHCLGEAADIRDVDKKNNKALFDVFFKLGNFDQLIYEDGNDQYPDWIHVSYKKSGNRKQALRMKNGKTIYRKYNLVRWS